MRGHFVRNWSAVALRGVSGILFGFAALLWFKATLPALVLFFGLFALVDGALAVVAGSRLQSLERGWLVEGFVGMAFGLIALLWFGATLPPLANLIALWAIATAVFELSAAIRMRREIPGDVSLVFAGSGSLLLGVVTLSWPSANPTVLAGLLGCYALVFGASMISLAFQLRRLSRRFASYQSGHTATGSR